jgi:hypothetical protein
MNIGGTGRHALAKTIENGKEDVILLKCIYSSPIFEVVQRNTLELGHQVHIYYNQNHQSLSAYNKYNRSLLLLSFIAINSDGIKRSRGSPSKRITLKARRCCSPHSDPGTDRFSSFKFDGVLSILWTLLAILWTLLAVSDSVGVKCIVEDVWIYLMCKGKFLSGFD